MKKSRIAAFAALVFLAPVVASCGGSSTTEEPVGSIALSPAAVLIDVRTPAEFAEGYVTGALNIDVSDPSFESRIATLDKNASYNVYCRSGNRSAAAIDIMKKAGFTKLNDLGSVQEAAEALSLPVVAD